MTTGAPFTEAELAARRGGIGSSEIAAICGESPYANAHSIWLDKMGLRDFEDTEPTRWGRMMEPLVGRRYTEETGVELVRGNVAMVHPDFGWALASPDFLAPDRLVECKVSFRTGAQWSSEEDGVPTQYLLQAQWQAGILGYDRVDVAVFIAEWATFRIYQLRFDQELFEHCLHIADRFWRDHVLARTPPPIDHSDDARRSLIAHFGRDRRPLIDGPSETQEWMDRRLEASSRLEQAEKDKALATNKLCELIGDAEGIRTESHYATWKVNKAGNRVFRLAEFKRKGKAA